MTIEERTSKGTLWRDEPTKVVSMESYQIYIGYGFIASLPQIVRELVPAVAKYILITDEHLFELYGEQITRAFQAQDVPLLVYRMPSGELSKSREQKALIEDFMFEHSCHIDSLILALGGGVAGDLCGFVASTYMRGIDYIQIPTSFLSMVDSSVGAKTGINVEKYGKNLLGSFYRPKAVLIDVDFLKTLSQRDLSNGIAESIKMALTFDEKLFEFIENNINLIFEKDQATLLRIIHESVQLKANTVQQDERETSGLRSILNFGHSIGHAIEILCHGNLLHGECVAIGVVFETEIARNKGFLTNSNAVLSRISNLFKSFHLPTKIPANLTFPEIIEKMSIDKKNRDGKKNIVILTNIGSIRVTPRYTTAVDDEDLINLLDNDVSLRVTQIPNTPRNVAVPGSKSLSNRVLLLCALGQGPCRIDGLLYSVDTQTMLICLRQLGVRFHWQEDQSLLITGTNGQFQFQEAITFYLNNSGTSSRFLTSLCTILPAKSKVILTGDQRLKERPIEDLTNALSRNGNRIEYLEQQGCLPIQIESNGHFQGGEIAINADISSQYVTSLLLVSPFAKEALKLKLNSGKSVVSKPYIDMTIELMKSHFHIPISESEPFTYEIANSQTFANPSEIRIEGDASSASYVLGIAAVHPGLTITVDNLGSASLQGDSQFFRLLEAMGCQVEQTATTTTLTGPQKLRALPEPIDMNSMTDTFMTLACVAVFAEGLTQITNISNQRLKECNRIEAMVRELQKCGVDAQETDTGINIPGNNNQNIEQSARIHCYDDHRIAMAFSIVGTRAKHLVITDKHCVAKTYPDYWLHLQQTFGFEVLSPTLQPATSSNLVLFLIGMPCSGKTTLGQIVARQLNYQFIDVDAEISKEVANGSIREYINANGWSVFRSLERRVFKQILAHVAQLSEPVLVSCGGGCVETAEIRNELARQPYVIYINRQLEDIKEDYLLSQSNLRTSMDLDEKLRERKELYRAASNYEFPILRTDRDWPRIEQRLLAFIRTILQKQPTLSISEQSFFVSLTYKNLLNVSAETFAAVISGCEAIELRVDLLESVEMDFLSQQIAFIRKFSSLPIIYTVRSRSNYGTFADDAKKIFELLDGGIKFGCEIVDMEAGWNEQLRLAWLNKVKDKHPSIIASLHLKHSLLQFNQVVQQCTGHPRVNIIKVALDNDQKRSMAEEILPLLTRLKEKFEKLNFPKVILICMGEEGKLTRLLNQYLTPVTHPALDYPAAKGQLSVRQIQELRLALGLLQPKQFYLFGTPIDQSISPFIHQTAFDYFALPYKYEKYQTDDVASLHDRIGQANFAGASVTIPFKEQLFHSLSADPNYRLSDSAKQISAINTIHKLPDGSFHLDNTDWKAIYQLINAKVSKKTTVLILGSGGTARAALYALQQMPLIEKIYLFNPRTPEKASLLAHQYPNTNVLAVHDNNILSLENIHLLINTLPSALNYTLEPAFFQKNTAEGQESVLLDVNYLPYQTQLILQAQQYHWKIIYGIEMLIEQALWQLEIWTGKSSAIGPFLKQTAQEYYQKTFNSAQ